MSDYVDKEEHSKLQLWKEGIRSLRVSFAYDCLVDIYVKTKSLVTSQPFPNKKKT